MAYRIAADCDECGICINKCPSGAIYVTETNLYAIDPDRCTECIDLARRGCYLICHVNAIQLDPARRETPDELWAKRRARICQDPPIVLE
ncbi:MAG: 4Fe-4S binding protein [Anaerolineales bacterium]|nr:4Fe-4S binding protein [Anaerolineales bacterium]